jgi:tRNA threonylcarbamoyladenosine biosynthesis protein TsaB
VALLLAIDTSARTAGVALLDGDQVVAERTWRARGSHTVQLLPVTRDMLRAAGYGPVDLDAVGVAIGPGAFTGLRVGIATAKTIAWSLGIPCLGVGTLDALAATAPWATRVLAVLNAGRGEWFWALYGTERGRRRRLAPPQIGRPEEVLHVLNRTTLLVGECGEAPRELIATSFARTVELGDPRLPAIRPAALGLLAAERLAAGERDEPATLQPLYIRRPAAEERAGVRA